MKKAALILSVLLHPLILLNLGFVIIMFCHPYYKAKYYDVQMYTLLGFMLVHTFIFPMLGMMLLKYFRIISSLHLGDRKERTMPFLLTLSLFGATCYNLYNNNITGLPFVFLAASMLALALNIIINFFFKISSHAIGAAGLCGMLFACITFGRVGELLFIGTLSVIVAGLAGTSRLMADAHSSKEIYWGYLVGFISVFLTTSLYGI